MNFPIWSLLFSASFRAPKTPCADFSGTILGADAAIGLKPGDDVSGCEYDSREEARGVVACADCEPAARVAYGKDVLVLRA
jgi:hypothetical protein